MQHRTPAKEDKRLWMAALVQVALVGLMLRGVVSGDTGTAALVTLTLGYLGQSQAGQTLRARAARRTGEQEGER